CQCERDATEPETTHGCLHKGNGHYRIEFSVPAAGTDGQHHQSDLSRLFIGMTPGQSGPRLSSATVRSQRVPFAEQDYGGKGEDGNQRICLFTRKGRSAVLLPALRLFEILVAACALAML